MMINCIKKYQNAIVSVIVHYFAKDSYLQANNLHCKIIVVPLIGSER